MVAGTPEYVAPEQALGGAPDKSSDLYTFGVMLFEMLTGRLPFEPGPLALDRVSELLLAHANQKAPSPEALGVPLPHEVSVLLRELLEKRPSSRPAGAAVVRVRLAQARSAEARRFVKAPSRALPPPVPAAAQRPYRPLVALVSHGGSSRVSKNVVTIGLLALLALAALGVFGWLGHKTADPVLPPPPASSAPVMPRPPKEVQVVAVGPVAASKGPAPYLCVPSEKWRAAARVNLLELEQQAGDDAFQAGDFEERETGLLDAITQATTAEQCKAAELRLRQLTVSLRL